MDTQILTTKLHIPPVRPNLVPRPRLIERLDEGLRPSCKLTLISAPAGFGKTSLLGEWSQQSKHPIAWLALDRADNNPSRFWTYVVAALQSIQPDVGEAVLAALQSPRPTPTQSIVTHLINEIAQIQVGFALVLDDFHMITAPDVWEGVFSLLSGQPPQMHLVLATRADPPWPLARLRARGEMIELRADDLRFTKEETAAFLNQLMDLDLAPEDVSALQARTEGWVAGLQMAALSMRGRQDLSGFIRAFTGSHRFILDYLVEEVLDRQSGEVQAFLLKTSILERMTAPLCNAVTGREDSQATLVQLEQANLFLIPLDDERRWYRYHQLFAELLRSRLELTQPNLAPALHRRASAWFEQNGLIAEAVSHALAASDVEQVAQLVRGNVLAMMDRGELPALGGWLDALPDQGVQTHPWMCLALAWTRVYAGPLNAVEPLLQDTERALTGFAGTAAEAQHITGHIAAVRAYAAVLFGKLHQVGELARAALANLPEQDLMARGVAMAVLATALRFRGDFSGAEQVLVEAIAVSEAAGNNHVTVTILCDLAEQQIAQGQLRRAAATCRDALQLADSHCEPGRQRLPVAGLACTCLSQVLHEWNDLESALHYAREGVELSRRWGWAEILVKNYVALAQAFQASGDTAGALEAIEDAKMAASELGPDFGANLAAEAQVRLLQGDVAAAAGWAAQSESRLGVRDETALPYPDRHLLWARILIAQGRLDQASDLLAWLLQKADASGAERLQVVASILQSMVLQAQGDHDRGLTALERALSLAEPENYVRVFVREGTPMGQLLRQAVARGIAVTYASRLLEALEKDRVRPARVVPTSTVEPLSGRELEVLRLLTTHLASTDIARELTVSLNTVRTHIKNIYSKLNVHSRGEAVQRAEELDLL